MKHTNSVSPRLETLEDRNCPTLFFMVDGAGNLTLSGAPVGDLGLVWDGPDTIDIFDFGADPIDPILDDVTVTGDIDIRIDGGDDYVYFEMYGYAVNGDVNIDTGSGEDTVCFNLFSGPVFPGAITGDLRLTNVNTAEILFTEVAGDVLFNDARENFDSVFDFDGGTVGGDTNIRMGNSLGGNTVALGGADLTDFFGNVYVRVGNASGGGNAIDVATDTTIGGRVSITAGNGGTDVGINGLLFDSVYIRYGNPAFGSVNTFDLTPGAVISGRLNIVGSNGDENITVDSGAVIDGSVSLNLRNGDNLIQMDGDALVGPTLNGRTLSIRTGSGDDDLNFVIPAIDGGLDEFSAPGTSITVYLGAGDDDVDFGTNNDFGPRLFVDFGPGFDSVAGTIPSQFRFRNLP